MGPPDPHPLRRGSDSGSERQPRQRRDAGARTEGRLSAPAKRDCHSYHAVPRLGRDVHGALPEPDPRRQRDAAGVGDQSGPRPVLESAADADSDAARCPIPVAGRGPPDRAVRAIVSRVAGERVRQLSIRRASAPAATLWLAAALFAASGSVRAAADNPRSGADYFPNVTLTTQDGVEVRFYDDLLKGKIVAINLIYTTCTYACPLETARMAQVQKKLGDRMGREIFFYSITIDPEHDTPAVLKEYAEKFHAGPGWLFLTGKQADIELISKKIGLYSAPNPSNPDGHQPYLLVGNEATGQWMRNSAVDNPSFLARTIGDWLNSWQNTNKEALKSYAEVPTSLTLDRGQYTFANHCAACHTIGRGDHLGPDLLGVSATRDREWLTRFIVAPDKVRATGDPIALALREKYKQVVMPSLDLGPADAAGFLHFIDQH